MRVTLSVYPTVASVSRHVARRVVLARWGSFFVVCFGIPITEIYCSQFLPSKGTCSCIYSVYIIVVVENVRVRICGDLYSAFVDSGLMCAL